MSLRSDTQGKTHGLSLLRMWVDLPDDTVLLPKELRCCPLTPKSSPSTTTSSSTRTSGRTGSRASGASADRSFVTRTASPSGTTTASGTRHSGSTRWPVTTRASSSSTRRSSRRCGPVATTRSAASKTWTPTGSGRRLAFPQFPRFAGQTFLEGADHDARVGVRAGVERLRARRMVRDRPGPAHPAVDRAACGAPRCVRPRSNAPPHAVPAPSRSRRTLPRSACRPSGRTNGTRCSRRWRRRTPRSACTSVRRPDRSSPTATRRLR